MTGLHSRLPLLCLTAAAVITLASVETRAAEQDVFVETAVWTPRVVEQEPVRSLGSKARVQPLTFWTKVRGTRKALERLAADGRLPLRHRWHYLQGAYVGVSTVQPTDTITLDLGTSQRHVLDHLTWETRENGTFDWRMWSRKDNVMAGYWRVTIVDRTGRPIQCRTGTVISDCSFEIELVGR